MKILRFKDIKLYREKQLSSYLGSTDFITLEQIDSPVLDHDHYLGYCRRVLDRNSNQFEGKVLSAYTRFLKYKTNSTLPDLLRRLASYLEQDYSANPIHPNTVKKAVNKFGTLVKEVQNTILITAKILPAKTKAERKKQYRDYLMRPENIYNVE